MAGITLDECIQEFNLSDEVLDTKCSDEHILTVSTFLDWKGVARYLKLMIQKWVQWSQMGGMSRINDTRLCRSGRASLPSRQPTGI